MSQAPSWKHPSDDGTVGSNATFPPNDATSEEIARALFRLKPEGKVETPF